MNDQVYLIGELRRRVLDQLWREPHVMTVAGLAARLALPDWAVAKGLEAARIAGDAESLGPFNGADLWAIKPAPEPQTGVSADERSAVANISLEE